MRGTCLLLVAGFALLDSRRRAALFGNEVGALGAPDLGAGRGRTPSCSYGSGFSGQEPQERAVAACADEAYGRSFSDCTERWSRASRSKTTAR
jgi:hypothetical protein